MAPCGVEADMISRTDRRRSGTVRGAFAAAVCSCLLAGAGCGGGKAEPIPTDPAAREAYNWIRQLEGGDILERDAAARKLGELCHPSAVAPLVESAQADYQVRVRVQALLALGRHEAKDVAPHAKALIELLEDDEEQVRQAAAEALGLLGFADALDALTRCVGDPKDSVRVAAAEALGRLGGAGLERLAQAFDGAAPEVRAAIAEIIGQAGSPAHIDVLIRGTRADDHYTRRAAVAALGRLGDDRGIAPAAELIRKPLSDAQIAGYEAHKQRKPTKAEVARILHALDAELIARGRHPGGKQAHGWLFSGPDAAMNVHRRLIDQQRQGVEAMTRSDAVQALCGIASRGAVEAILQAVEGRRQVAATQKVDTGRRHVEILDLEAAAKKAVAGASGKLLSNLLSAFRDASRPAGRRIIAADLLAGAEADGFRQALVAALADADVAVRSHAAGLLAAEKAPEALDPLMRLLQAEDLAVRRAAVAALDKYQDRRSAGALLQCVLNRASQVRVEAVHVLAKLGDPQTVQPLIELYPKLNARDRGDRFVRVAILEALGQMKAADAVDLLIGEVRATRDTGTLYAALKALGEIGDRRATQPIIARLKGPALLIRYDVNHDRLHGIPALGKLHDPASIDFLAQLADAAPTVGSRKLALAELGRQKHPKAVAVLIGMLVGTKVDAGMKESYVAPALIESGEVAVAPLLKILTEAAPASKEQGFDPGHYAAQVLSFLGEPALPGLIRVAATDTRKHVLGRAIQALKEFGDERVLPPLARLLKHPDTDIRKWTAVALGTVGNPKAVDCLRAASPDADPQVEKWIQWAIGQHVGPAASQPATAASGPGG